MKKDLDQQLQQTLRDLGMSGTDWQRRISASDMVYLLDQCPFLQITDTGVQSDTELPALQIITAQSGWKIHNYGNALSSSPGELLFGNPRLKPTRLDAKDDSGGGGDSGTGTMVNQAVITAIQMVEIAIAQGWSGVLLIDGHPLMAWAAWMKTLESDMEMEGFTPTAKDYAKLKRVKGPYAGPAPSPKPGL
jgi:hypothetical protein